MGFKTVTQFINSRPIHDMPIVYAPYIPLFVNGATTSYEPIKITSNNVTTQTNLPEELVVESIDPNLISEWDLEL